MRDGFRNGPLYASTIKDYDRFMDLIAKHMGLGLDYSRAGRERRFASIRFSTGFVDKRVHTLEEGYGFDKATLHVDCVDSKAATRAKNIIWTHSYVPTGELRIIERPRFDCGRFAENARLLNEAITGAVRERLVKRKRAEKSSARAEARGTATKFLSAFVGAIPRHPRFDREQLVTLIKSLGLSHFERGERKFPIMAELFPLLDKWTFNRKISDPNACEHMVL